jgi:DNA invertase Pin-like site-specific DNA recombinase
MRAAIYARVSTADGRQDAENQLAELRRFASTQQWEIDTEYIDHESGGQADRREFKRLLEDAAQRRFDVVLFWALDRFTREGALETLKYLDQFTAYGVGYRSFTEPYLDSCGMFKDAIIAILGTIAKQERIRLSERIRAGLDRVRLQGTRSGRPIGRPRAVFRRDEAVVLREAGYSWRQIASKLGAGVTTIRKACQDARTACGNP